MKLINFHPPKGSLIEFEISDAKYTELKNARQVLVKIFDAENLFDQLIESYLDAKTAMYESSIRLLADCSDHDYVKSYLYRSKLNRLFFNALNFSKLYLDKSFFSKNNTSLVKRLTKSDKLHELVSKYREVVSTKEYELGCQLRNYVQHDSLPVDSYTTGVRHDLESEVSFSVFHIPLNMKKLRKSSTIKNRLLGEFSESIDFHEVMDGYILALSKMHYYNRELLNETEKKAIQIINQNLSAFNEKLGVGSGHQIIDKKTREIEFSIGIEWFDVVNHLKSKNRRPIDFKRFTHSPYKRG
ncbi:hypothetical protein [Vibrio rumoiensis]|uniref:Cthe-2314-like HEPN domain-containing protein n=1 Tax=Vibrio rumoiensis TaxID=76258 RepID=A0ABW7IZU1_9VIBR